MIAVDRGGGKGVGMKKDTVIQVKPFYAHWHLRASV